MTASKPFSHISEAFPSSAVSISIETCIVCVCMCCKFATPQEPRVAISSCIRKRMAHHVILPILRPALVVLAGPAGEFSLEKRMEKTPGRSNAFQNACRYSFELPGARESVWCCLLRSVSGAESIMALLPLSVGRKFNVPLMKLSCRDGQSLGSVWSRHRATRRATISSLEGLFFQLGTTRHFLSGV